MGKDKQIPLIPNRVYKDQLVTIDDLQAFKEELTISLLRLIKEFIAKPEKKWIKSYEVRKLLGMSNGTLHTLRSNGTIPFSKIGNTAYYDMEDITRVMEKYRRPLIKEMYLKQKSSKI